MAEITEARRDSYPQTQNEPASREASGLVVSNAGREPRHGPALEAPALRHQAGPC